MESQCYAYLMKVTSDGVCKRKKINASEFKIGRSKQANLCLTDVSVSRNHCVILSGKDEWSLKNESQFGTIVSGRNLAVNEACQLKDGDVIQLGQQTDYTYKFCIRQAQDDLALKRPRIEGCESEDSSHPPDTCNSGTVNEDFIREETLLKKENEELNSQLQKVIKEKDEVRNQYEDEKKRIETELQSEKNALEERLKAMEDMLSSKEREQQELNEKLKRIDEENKKLELLRQEQAVLAEKIISELKNEVVQKELSMRETLEREMESLLNSRKQIEESIRLEKEQTEGACAEKLKSLEEELSRVKCDLTNAEGKRCLLERELEEAEKAKLKETESSLKAKREALAEFSNLIEMELQCSICNELFIKATTLNCTHTVCHYCLQEWKKKKNLCPMCRAPIITENHSIVLDSFIDKIVENLSEELKKRRSEMIEERKAMVLLATQQQKSKGKKKKTRILIPIGPPAGQNITVVPQATTSQGTANAQAPDVIFLGPGEDLYTVTVGNTQPDSTNRYGGYGACFICGRRGHWAGGCPYNARGSAT
ncbi:E3 ubiquitin-protein ligase rnf8-A-like [Ischnura elegans]|uniref:E3 ubiquitin-protein ligase rnf8-A-like n=1 Tax=Ischnura elegans TaxID=197161 RepID=UPI001ED86EF2|nr:E3 ubiquitin-protein ligase rnf8-A-like [Ischnura elegans]